MNEIIAVQFPKEARFLMFIRSKFIGKKIHTPHHTKIDDFLKEDN